MHTTLMLFAVEYWETKERKEQRNDNGTEGNGDG